MKILHLGKREETDRSVDICKTQLVYDEEGEQELYIVTDSLFYWKGNPNDTVEGRNNIYLDRDEVRALYEFLREILI